MFVDDTKQYAVIKSQIDEEQLESYTVTLEDWTRDWLLDFIADKCKLVQVGRPLFCSYTMTSETGARVNVEVTEEDEHKNLGHN